jgi:hypothetical protein
LLDGLKPLRADADLEDAEAIRAIVRSGLIGLVHELGEEGGPLNTRVDEYFERLLGVHEPDDADEDGERPEVPASESQLGLLRETFGLEQSGVNRIPEEQNLTNFFILVDYVNSLRFTWVSQRGAFDRTGNDAFLGTQSVLLARALAVVAEAVQETYFAMDSVFLGPAERDITELELAGLTEGKTTRIFVGELLQWVENFALDEGPRLIQEGGKIGVASSFLPTVKKLARLVTAAAAESHSGPVVESTTEDASSNNGSGPRVSPTAAFHSVRVGRALDELSYHLEKTSERADQIKRDPAPSISAVLLTLSHSIQGEIMVLSVIGEDFKRDANLHLQNKDNKSEKKNPHDLFFLHDSELKATFDQFNSADDWLVVVTNPDGQRDQSKPFKIVANKDLFAPFDNSGSGQPQGSVIEVSLPATPDPDESK